MVNYLSTSLSILFANSIQLHLTPCLSRGPRSAERLETFLLRCSGWREQSGLSRGGSTHSDTEETTAATAAEIHACCICGVTASWEGLLTSRLQISACFFFTCTTFWQRYPGRSLLSPHGFPVVGHPTDHSLKTAPPTTNYILWTGLVVPESFA